MNWYTHFAEFGLSLLFDMCLAKMVYWVLCWLSALVIM